MCPLDSFPDQPHCLVSTSSHFLSIHLQRFTCVRLLGSYLTRSRRAFSFDVHHPGHWAHAARSGLEPDHAIRLRGPALIGYAARLLQTAIMASSPRRRGTLWSGYARAKSPDVQRFANSATVGIRPFCFAITFPATINSTARCYSSSAFPSRTAASASNARAARPNANASTTLITTGSRSPRFHPT